MGEQAFEKGGCQTPFSGSLIDVGKQFAAATCSSFQNKRLQKAFTYFQVLILLSYLTFLESINKPREEIDAIIRSVPAFGSRDCRRLCQIGLKVNRLISGLVEKGWKITLATEFFFLCVYPSSRRLACPYVHYRCPVSI
jgi:hypothetical protein